MEISTMGWLLLAAGFVPWRVVWTAQKRRQGRRWQQCRSLTLQAIFWQMTVEQRPQSCMWQLTLPIIAHSKAAVWAVLQDLIKE